jgi:transposase
VRKTWAPRGETPIIHHRYRHDRISVISGISVAPRRRRVGLYFRCHAKNIRHDEVCEFLRYLLRHLRGHVFVVWDNASIHKGERIREICHQFPRLHLEALPPYAPQLNPDEAVWADAKGRLANGCPDDITALGRRLRRTLRDIKRSPRRLRRCIHQSELPPFLR